MTWTYNSADLATALNAVRLLIGDTETTDPLLQDEEINYFITENNSVVYLAASDSCWAIASKYARQADTKNGELSVKASQRAKAYELRAQQLKEQIGSMSEIFVGGATLSDVDALNDDSSLVQPVFKLREFDYYGTVPPDPDCADN